MMRSGLRFVLCCAVLCCAVQAQDFNMIVSECGGDPARLSTEQRAAINPIVSKMLQEYEAFLQEHGGAYLGSRSGTTIGVFSNDAAANAMNRWSASREKDRTQIKAILAWRNGKNPNAGSGDNSSRPSTSSETPKPQPPQKTDAEKKAEENATKVENADMSDKTPYDNLDKIKDLKLTPEQQQKIDALRKQRQQKMAQSVKMAKTKRYSTASRRSLYRVLRYFFSLYNYRIRYTMTPTQIGIFDRNGVPVQVDRLEDLLAGMSAQEVFSDDKNAPEMVETGDKKRLTRTNFAEYDEFRKLLVLDDEQLHELAALDSDARGNFEAATEVILKDRANADAILQAADTEFAAIQAKIRKLIPRGQKEDFNTLMLLLFDALEFPAQNMASFAAFDLPENEVKKLDSVLQPFLKANTKAVIEPGEVSVTKLRELQTTLESQIQTALPANVKTAWNDAKMSQQKIYDAVRKYKEQ